METSSETLGQKENSWIHQPQSVFRSEPLSDFGEKSQEGWAAREQPACPREKDPVKTAGSQDIQVSRASEAEIATLQVPLSLKLIKTSG